MKYLALFDVDRTLILGSKLKDDVAFPTALEKVYGVKTNVYIINRHGMTDKSIITKILEKNNIDKKIIDEKMEKCCQILVDVFKKNFEKDEVLALDGVKDFLDELKKQDVLIGLVTGNLEDIAWKSLEKVGLKHYFSFGGFGSDSPNRTDLVKIALQKAEELGFKQNENVFLFGDTPSDIISGNEAGVKTVGVATGVYSTSDLKEAGATFVFENLKGAKTKLKLLKI